MLNTLLYSLLLFVFSSNMLFAQGSWDKIKTPTDFNLLKVFYLDSLHCWVGGDSGVILFSGDGGDSWDVQNSGVNNYISDIFFVNDTLGWALTFFQDSSSGVYTSVIVTTTNGGKNWNHNYFRHNDFILRTIYFNDELNGWVGAEPYGIFYTQDSGLNWYEATIDTGTFRNLPVQQIKFSSKQYGFAVGGHVDAVGVCWSSSDSGKVWKPFGIGSDLILDFVFDDSLSIISLTAELEGYFPTSILKFNLKTNFWTYDSLDLYAYTSGMSKRTQFEIWGASSKRFPGFVLKKDLESDWEFISSQDSFSVSDISFTDSLHGIAVGDSGYILKYIPDSTVSVDYIKYPIINNFNLEQNFPNPFNPSTKIQYSISDRQFVSLKIYDLLGREVATLVNEERSAGNYLVELNVAQKSFPPIASGIYFYQLKTENNIASKKMILLK